MTTRGEPAVPIAIIGVAGIFAGAQNAQEYWDNILNKIDCLTEVPPSRWNVEDYYDPDPAAPDKTYCKRGGFIPDIDFDPMEFGLPPNILEVTDVSQLLALVVARDVLADAGYGDGRDFDRERTGVVLGVAGGQKLITSLASRLQYPVWRRVLLSSGIAENGHGSHHRKNQAGLRALGRKLLPRPAGQRHRRAHRQPLRPGRHRTAVVDAACASCLAAAQMAVDQLAQGRAT